jgi:hypothetical protein
MPSKSLSLCRRYPHDPTANRPVPGEGGYQQRHLYEVQHPPQVVCQDRHTELGPHFLQPPHWKVAVSPSPLHRSKQVFYQLLTPLHHLRSTPYTLLHIEGELQEIARGIAGAPCRSRHGTSEAACFEGEFVDKGVGEADGIVLGHVVVEALGEAEHFVAVRALDMAH